MELKLGYCASELVRPEIVLTADNLGMLDQTSANDAGLPIALFTPVAEYMNRAATAEAAAADPGACCEELRSQPDRSIESPVESDGPAGERLPFSRALLIGFDQPVAGDAISLYFDAAPGRPEVELVAEVFHAGRFERSTHPRRQELRLQRARCARARASDGTGAGQPVRNGGALAAAAAEVGRRGMVSASARNLT